MPARISHERLRRVEAHRLGGKDAGVKVFWIVRFEPGARVDEVGERERVGLWKAELGERLELGVDLFARWPVNPLCCHALHEFTAQLAHPLVTALGPHSLAQLIGLRGTEARGVDRDLHELLLKQGHPQRLLERVFE